MDHFIVFEFNDKSFETAILFFFFFFFILFQFSRQTVKSFLVNVLRLVIKEAYDQDLAHFLETPKNISVKFVSHVIRDTCGTQHRSFTVTSIHNIQKNTINSEKFGNRLAIRRLQKIQGSKQREIESLSKKVRRKKKEKNVQKKKLIRAPYEAIPKLLLKNMCHQKIYLPIYILLVDDHDEATQLYLPSNKQTSFNKSSSKLKLFKNQFYQKYLS